MIFHQFWWHFQWVNCHQFWRFFYRKFCWFTKIFTFFGDLLFTNFGDIFKNFPAHAKLTPGLYLMTCGCKYKVIYGFSMMLTGESPRMLFDIIMTRFESDYNPEIIYDASCRVKEYGLNRELKRFMSIRITTDQFHQVNHKSCSASFRSSKYLSLENINSEACEQTNSVLRKISSSTTYMSPSLYMRVLTLFMANLNIIANNKK